MGKVLRFKRHVLMVSTGLVSGLVFAADLASWHLGIVKTKVANAAFSRFR